MDLGIWDAGDLKDGPHLSEELKIRVEGFPLITKLGLSGQIVLALLRGWSGVKYLLIWKPSGY